MSRPKPPPDPRGGHVRIYWNMMDSVAWRALTHTEQALYLAMRRELRLSNNGDISATLATLQEAGFTSSSTLSKSLRALMIAGFIQKTRQGAIAGFGGLRHCNLFRFTDVETYEMSKKGIAACKATDDWKKWRSKDEVKAAIAQAHRAAQRPSKQPERTVEENAAELRRSSGDASIVELIGSNVASIDERRRATRLRSAKAASLAADELSR